MVDFKKLKEDAKTLTIKPMFGIVLGPSGAGKSFALGSVGVPTLVLHASAEHHGGIAAQTHAKKLSGEVVAIDFTVFDKTTGLIDCDAIIKQLMEILSQPDLSKEFGAVAVDSANELQSIFRGTKYFKEFCKTDKGGHNSFKEGESDINQFKHILAMFNKLNGQGVHVFMTCAAITKSLADDGSVAEATPSLLGFTVAHDLIRGFSDVLLVSRITDVDEETGVVSNGHKFIFKANVSKTSKDLKGNVMKTQNFSCRISGLSLEDLPETCDANLGKIIAGRSKKVAKSK